MNRYLIALLALALLAHTTASAADKNADQLLQEYTKILGDDVQAALSSKDVSKGAKFTIDPDKGIDGLPFGSTTEMANKVLGYPTGVVKLGETKVALIYGHAHSLIFRKNRLISAFGTPTLLNTALTGGKPNPGISLIVAPGIEMGMEKEKVEKLLNKTIDESPLSFDFTYETENADITLKFVKNRQGAFEVFSYTITHFSK